jgi:hypothetical protein
MMAFFGWSEQMAEKRAFWEDAVTRSHGGVLDDSSTDHPKSYRTVDTFLAF